MDINTLRQALEEQNYIFDEELLVTLNVALTLGKPVLVEGAPGTGKTEIAKVLSAGLGFGLIRLQCYEGLDDSKALYEWNYQKQLLSIQMDSSRIKNSAPADLGDLNDPRSAGQLKDQLKGQLTGQQGDSINHLFTREFLLERPLLEAISTEQQSVLLIDEIDKTDEEFEAFLLELLSDFQISVPELGTIKARTRPVVVLTSNSTRELSEALRRRCVFIYLDYPGKEKELAIVKARLPGIDEKLAAEAIEIISTLRYMEQIQKKPSISETLDWLAALTAIGRKKLDESGFDSTRGFILKNRDDLKTVEKLGGYSGLLSRKPG